MTSSCLANSNYLEEACDYLLSDCSIITEGEIVKIFGEIPLVVHLSDSVIDSQVIRHSYDNDYGDYAFVFPNTVKSSLTDGCL